MTVAAEDPASGLPVGRLLPEPGPAPRPGRGTVLEGRHVLLRALDPATDADPLFDAACGPGREALWAYLSPEPFADRAAFQAHLGRAALLDDPLLFAILDAGSGEAVGHATYMRIEPPHRVIEVGNILFSTRLQRTPGATEAMYLMARHAFEDLGYRRYEWKCNALNAPSRRAALRYGFSYEGLFRDHMIVKGRTRDTAWFSMLASEWPARRRAFERWLDPSNFDAGGRQKVSLSTLNATTLEAGGRVLRRATPADAAAFDLIQQAAFAWNREMLGREPLPLKLPADEVLARFETWLLEDGNGVVGALALDPRSDDLEIWSLSVDPSRQNAGLGRELLAAADARARQLGLEAIRLYTGAVLTKNVDWYRRRGYGIERTEELPDRRIVHMVKRLER